MKCMPWLHSSASTAHALGTVYEWPGAWLHVLTMDAAWTTTSLCWAAPSGTHAMRRPMSFWTCTVCYGQGQQLMPVTCQM